MRPLLTKAVGWILALAAPAWFVFVIYGWITYTGVWRIAAEWQLATFGSYGDKGTFLALVFGPVFVLGAPFMIMEKLRPGSTPALPKGPATLARAAKRPMTSARPLVIIGLAGVLVAAGAGWIGYQKSQAEIVFEPIEAGRADVPQTRHAEVSGIAQTGGIVGITRTYNGNKTEEMYLPLTGPGWRKSEPVTFFLMPRGNVYAGPDGAKFFDPGTRPFPVTQRGTLFSDGLPGLVRTEFERRNFVLAPTTYVLDQKVDADLDIWFGTALAGALASLVCLLAALFVRLRGGRSRAA